ncbi:MAG: PucR C-terminal helix-turn-helix protein [Actinomycetia bacterium]|nr:PucR C-terminal helix-turn-helix protein [Actinomycetes bacterium]
MVSVAGRRRAGRVQHRSGTAQEFERELNDLALGGDGWGMVLARLAAQTDRVCRLIGVHGGVFHATDGSTAAMVPTEVARVFAEVTTDDGPGTTTVTCEDGWRGRALAVRAGRRRVGLLLLAEPADRPLPGDALPYLFAASTAVAIVAVQRDAAAVARSETAERLIDELRYGPLRGEEEVTRTAARFGLRLDLPHAAAVFFYSGSNRRTWSTALSWLEMPVQEIDGHGWAVLGGDLPKEVSRIRVRLQGMVGDAPVLAAVGPVVTGPNETARSFRDAETVLDLLRRRPGEAELLHSSLGLAQLLLAIPAERLDAYVVQQLGPLLDRAELMDTLDAWLATNGSRAAVAERMHLHRNSVGYRVAQIRQLLGADPLDPAMASRLRAALIAGELLQILAEKARTQTP